MATLTEVNARTLANFTAISNSQEQKWAMKVVLESRGKHPFKVMLGGYKGGKPFIEIMDTRKMAGNTVYLTTEAPLGGAGVQGDTTRSGTEEKSRHNVYSFTVGMKWHGTAATKLARGQTVAGRNFSEKSSTKLAEWLGWQQGWDLEMEMRARAHGRNTIYANRKLSIDGLGTGDYLSGSDIDSAKLLCSTNQGKPLVVGTQTGSGAPIKRYVVVATDYALQQWKQTSSYQNILAQACERGAENNLFEGSFPRWNGNYIYEWAQEFGSQYGPVACGSLPVAVLGEAIAANTTAPTLKGGGDATGAALTAPQYFAAFRNAVYTGFEGEKIATASTRRYWMVWNTSGAAQGKFGFYSGTANNGNQLTSDERLRAAASGGAVTTLTDSTITWGVAPWTTDYVTDSHPIGSLIFEVNSKGVPFAYNYLLGQDALITGYGVADDGVCMASPTKEIQDHGRLAAFGIECVWGSRAIQRTDGMVNGYVLIVSGFKLPGMPDIS
jgi:hypothetical protein